MSELNIIVINNIYVHVVLCSYLEVLYNYSYHDLDRQGSNPVAIPLHKHLAS